MLQKVKQLLKQKFKDIDTHKSYAYLKNNVFKPDVIFDIGAYKGEYAKLCTSFWSGADIYCFEVLPECDEPLSKLPNVHHVRSLAGEKDTNDIRFNVAATASSVLPEHHPQDFPQIKVPMTRLDTFCSQRQIVPDLLKIDTQGYEFQVLVGCEAILGNISIIHAEVNLIDIHQKVVLAPEVIHYLYERDFVPFDIVETHRRPLDQALWQIDVLFCHRNSPLRADKRWSA